MRTLSEQLERLQRIAPLLRCPQCGGELDRGEDEYACQGCVQRYPVVNGVPILLSQEMRNQGLGRSLGFDEHASTHPYSPASEGLISELHTGWVLDLGAGGKQTDYAHVIQMDVFRFPHTDVVGSADGLPFRTAVFDAVVSQAVFEHLQYPEAASAEIWRVLKPDGVAKIDTAFLQPEHAYPHHYFNATEAGLKHWFRDFELAWSGVEPYQHPQWALLWLLDVYLAALPAEPQHQMGQQTLAQCVAALKRLQNGQQSPDDQVLASALGALSPESVRKLAAGVSVRAVKRISAAHVDRPREASNSGGAQLLGLERRLEALTGEKQAHRERLQALAEVQLIAADRTRFLLHEYMLMRQDPTVNPGFAKPLLNLVVRELRRWVPQRWWVRGRQMYRSRRQASLGLSAERLAPTAGITFVVEPNAVVSLLDQFFSLTHQTHADWALWILEPQSACAQLQRLVWELAQRDRRVTVVKGNQPMPGATTMAWVSLAPHAVLSFDAVEELVTLVQQQPWVTQVSADCQAWSADLREVMRCWSQVAEGSTFGMQAQKLSEGVVKDAGQQMVAKIAAPQGEYFSGNCCNTVAHIPKVLYRLIRFADA